MDNKLAIAQQHQQEAQQAEEAVNNPWLPDSDEVLV